VETGNVGAEARRPRGRCGSIWRSPPEPPAPPAAPAPPAPAAPSSRAASLTSPSTAACAACVSARARMCARAAARVSICSCMCARTCAHAHVCARAAHAHARMRERVAAGADACLRHRTPEHSVRASGRLTARAAAGENRHPGDCSRFYLARDASRLVSVLVSMVASP